MDEMSLDPHAAARHATMMDSLSTNACLTLGVGMRRTTRTNTGDDSNARSDTARDAALLTKLASFDTARPHNEYTFVQLLVSKRVLSVTKVPSV